MRLDDEEESANIEDRRGQGGGGGFQLPLGGGGGLQLGGGKMGLGTIAIVVVLALVFGINPMTLLGGGGTPDASHQQEGGQPQQIGQPQPAIQAPAGQRSEGDKFVAQVLGTTERTWGRLFPEQVGQPYEPPRLVLFSGTVRSGCGAAESAMGPFYCPADKRVYLDQSFFDELSRRFGAPGDFAAAYVIAHEVGHHIQTVLGISDQVRKAQASASKTQGNALQVRMELQADCLAGVWGHDNKTLLEAGDVEEAMRAAQAIGDDTLQKAAQGVVVPESFTHGSSAQRMRWFRRGFDTGQISACDTFAARQL
ncbi:neutral zinc metallopeptidase [Sandarakinorhabdus sp.]|uniref:KPN_02809 family neutral zinc metallopeptidase n=1 Tax=Sandarakinorhabdus sp. TaxID=1916663 RepID=UPI00286E2673|nr:neutral zinc metallopeptidase [Sandarakinorhabdus sp.]